VTPSVAGRGSTDFLSAATEIPDMARSLDSVSFFHLGLPEKTHESSQLMGVAENQPQ